MWVRGSRGALQAEGRRESMHLGPLRREGVWYGQSREVGRDGGQHAVALLRL